MRLACALALAVACVACGDNRHLADSQLVVSSGIDLHTTEAGGTATFDVTLTRAPAADVVIDLESSMPGEGEVRPHALVFRADRVPEAQAVTVIGLDDQVADGNQTFTVTLTAEDTVEVAPVTIAITNDDDDRAGFAVAPLAGLMTSEAGGSAPITVRLTSRPSAPVTIGVASSNPAEGIVDPGALVFAPDAWDVPQTIMVRGVDDQRCDGTVGYTIVLAPAQSEDPAYRDLDPDDVAAENLDDDTAGILVTPTSGLHTTEAGGTDTFTVVLASEPVADVTIPLASTDPGEATISPPSLVFTPADWNQPQTVTVHGVDDLRDDGDRPFTVMLAPALSSDPSYAGVDAPDVSGVNVDDDTAGILVRPSLGLVTTEAGGADSFAVVLAAQPAADVTIALRSSDTTEGTVAPASLTFTAASWNVPQVVTVSGVDDPIADGNIAYTIMLAPAISSDPAYSGLDGVDVAVTNVDNDIAGVTVAPTSGLLTSEFGDTDTFTVVLDTPPAATVTISLASSNPREATVSPVTLTFTPATWNVPQTVTVTGVDDKAIDGNVAYAIVTSPTASADPAYSGLPVADVAGTNIDDETPQVYVKARPHLTTSESGTSVQFQVRLTTQPHGPVTCPLRSSDTGEDTVSPTSLTFTPPSYGFQTVTVTGVPDGIVDGDQSVTILLDRCSANDVYATQDPPDVIVVNRDVNN